MSSVPFDIIAAVNNDEVLERNLSRSPVVRGGIARLIIERGHPNAGRAYNAGLQRSTSPVAVFAHQDVYFPRGWEVRAIDAIKVIESSDSQWAVLGLWGVNEERVFRGQVWCSGGNREHRGNTPAGPVVSIDEIVIIINRQSGLKFDDELPGFHLYATDICAQASKAGLGVHVIDAPAVHNSRHNLQVFDHMFFKGYRYMQRKWRKQLPMQTCTVPITRLGLPLYRAWLRREIRRRRMQSKIRWRNSDPAVIAARLGYE